MAEERNAIELRILDTDFHFKASETEDYVREVANFVNDELTKVKDRNPFTNHIRIAVLGCMNITEMLFEAKREVAEAEELKQKEVDKIAEIKNQVTIVEEEVAALKQEKVELIEKKEALEKEIEENNELLNQYREHLKQSKDECDDAKKQIMDLQNQLFENQIELVKATSNGEDISAAAAELLQ